MRNSRLLLFLILLAGAALRLWFLWASQWMIEGDEAAVGLQALHILRGDRPIFFPGQAYLGNFESYLTAAVFALFAPTHATLKLVPFVAALLFIYLSYRLGYELLDDERAGLFAALAAALAPAYFILWSLKARGGYIEALVMMQLILLWFNRWLTRPPRGRGALLTPFVVGIVAGYVCWMNPISVYVLAPIALATGVCAVLLVVAVRDRRPYLMQAGVAAVGALLGILPFWLYQQAYGNAALDAVAGGLPPQNSWLDLGVSAWEYFWHDGILTLLGIRGPKDDTAQVSLQLILSHWQLIVIPVYVAGVVALLAQIAGAGHRPAPLRFHEDSTPAPRNALIVTAILMLAFPIFLYGTLSGRNFAVLIPDSGLLTRYLLPLYIAFTLALGLLFSRLSGWTRAVTLAMLLLANFGSLAAADPVALARNEFANQPLPASSADLEDFLASNDLNFVLTNHWIGYIITFDTRERILTADYTDFEHGIDRFADYSRKVQASSNKALVVYNPHFEPNPIDVRLAQLGITYQKGDLPNFIIYYDFSRPLNPNDLDAVLQWPYW